MAALAFTMDDPESTLVGTAGEMERAIGAAPSERTRNAFLDDVRERVLAMDRQTSAADEAYMVFVKRDLRRMTKAKAYNRAMEFAAETLANAEVFAAGFEQFKTKTNSFLGSYRGEEAATLARALEIRLQLFVWMMERRARQYRIIRGWAARYRPMGQGPLRANFNQSDEDFARDIRDRVVAPPEESIRWAQSILEAGGRN